MPAHLAVQNGFFCSVVSSPKMKRANTLQGLESHACDEPQAFAAKVDAIGTIVGGTIIPVKDC